MSAAKAARKDSRSRDDLVKEIEFLRRGGWAGQMGPTLRWVVAGLTIVAVAYLVSETIVGVAREFAGKDTKADVAYRLLSDISVGMSLSVAFGLAGTGLAIRERKLRKQTVERLAKRNAELEAKIDAHRSSSQLTSRGDTNPEDR